MAAVTFKVPLSTVVAPVKVLVAEDTVKVPLPFRVKVPEPVIWLEIALLASALLITRLSLPSERVLPLKRIELLAPELVKVTVLAPKVTELLYVWPFVVVTVEVLK